MFDAKPETNEQISGESLKIKLALTCRSGRDEQNNQCFLVLVENSVRLGII